MTGHTEAPYRPRRVGEVWVRRETDEVAVYDPATQALHRLNSTALAIWELCDGETTPQEMIAAVLDVTDASPETAAHDIQATLSALSAAGLVS